MSFITIEEDKKKRQLLDFFQDFMTKEKAEAQAFNSLDAFKNSSAFQDLPESAQEQLQQYEGKKVMILVFENEAQALDFIEQAQTKGLFSKEQAETAMAHVNEQRQSQGFGM